MGWRSRRAARARDPGRRDRGFEGEGFLFSLAVLLGMLSNGARSPFKLVGVGRTTPQSTTSSQVACARGTTKPSSEATGCSRQRRKSLDSCQRALEGCVCVSLSVLRRTQILNFLRQGTFHFFVFSLLQKSKKVQKAPCGGGRCRSWCACR